MTSPIGEPGRHHAAPDDEARGEDPIVLDNSRVPPVDDPRDDDLIVLGNGRTSPGDGVPDDEQAVLEGEPVRDDDQVASGDYRVAPEDRLASDDDQVVRSEDDTAAGMPASGSASAASVPAGAAPAADAPSVAVPAGAAPAAAVPTGSADGGPGPSPLPPRITRIVRAQPASGRISRRCSSMIRGHLSSKLLAWWTTASRRSSFPLRRGSTPCSRAGRGLARTPSNCAPRSSGTGHSGAA